MGSFSDNHIDSYEKKIPVYQVYQMCRDGRIVFPMASSGRTAKKIERISETVEAILMGITLPIIYVSERQNGGLLVLDSSDRLRYFMEFLGGNYQVTGLEFYQELNGCGLKQLEQQFPRITSLLYDYRITFQIIEYTTPKYMHIQAGNYIEKWSFTREQGIRNELYGEEIRDFLDFLVWNIRKSATFFSRWNLNRQYMMLRILMYRFVFGGDIKEEEEMSMGLQLLLERTIECVMIKDKSWKTETAAEMKETTEMLMAWGKKARFDLTKERGKERQAKMLGYLYNVVWMCQERGYPVQWGLKLIAFDQQLWRDIDREKVNVVSIRRHYDEIEKRLRYNAESY